MFSTFRKFLQRRKNPLDTMVQNAQQMAQGAGQGLSGDVGQFGQGMKKTIRNRTAGEVGTIPLWKKMRAESLQESQQMTCPDCGKIIHAVVAPQKCPYCNRPIPSNAWQTSQKLSGSPGIASGGIGF